MSSDRPDIVRERSGVLRIWRRRDVPVADVRAVLHQDGVVLKEGQKNITRRVGPVVVKTSQGSFLRELARHTLRRSRYQQGWRAALHLAAHGVPAPRPVAHVEWGALGIVTKHATILEFLPDCMDVEHFADRILAESNGPEMLHVYLATLAASINQLISAGAIHTDLAGKNILTRDGRTFYFIDLDGILLGAAYTLQRRFAAHVQLYDSFLDRCGDEHLAPFLRAMIPDTEPFDAWLQRVKLSQLKRRARTIVASARATPAAR